MPQEEPKHFIPHEYQRIAIDKIKSTKDVALLLDCGLGKTPISLMSILEMGLKKTLVVAPAQVVENVWVQEAEKWIETQGLKISLVIGTAKQRIKALNTPADIYAISRDNIHWLKNLNHPMGDLNAYDMIILDESSSFKNPTATRTMCLYNLYHPKKLLLTATPMPKGLTDLFSQYLILDCGYSFGDNYDAFLEELFVENPHVTGQYFPKPGTEELMFNRVAPVTLSMKNTDLLKLPELVNVNNIVEFSSKEQAMYKALKRDTVIKIIDACEGDTAHIIRAVNRGVLTNKLAQLANGFVYTEDPDTKEKVTLDISDIKLRELQSILEAACAGGETVLVAYQFQHDLERLNALAKEMGLRYCNLCDKGAMQKYLSDEGVDVAFLHPKASGFGLNLQGKSHRLVWYALPWSYEEFAQTCARVYRQGQQYTTYIHIIQALGTVDEDIIDALGTKEGFNNRFKERTLAYFKLDDGTVLLPNL